jgi:ketosteroid isomerase-like protein
MLCHNKALQRISWAAPFAASRQIACNVRIRPVRSRAFCHSVPSPSVGKPRIVSPSCAELFVAQFVAAWARPDSATFAELWLDDGVFVHPTVASPLTGSEVPRWSERIKAAMPDFTFQADEWASRGDLMFLQWSSTATVGGRSLRWSGVDRFRLRDWRISEEVVYFDTLEIWAALDPAMVRPALIDLAGA